MESTYNINDLIADKYRLVNILGHGGTAITYEAEDLINHLSVAIKVLSLDRIVDWKIVELFEREAKILATLNHPKIPQYIDYFYLDTEDSRTFFLVQELIPGKSLADLVKQGWYFQEKEVKQIAQQVLEILDYLHNLDPSIIHRDVKPHNIIRNDAGEVYLVDLGAVQDVYRNTLTRSGTFVGTIDYMPPEQMRGQVFVNSDIYSLGCTILYLLTRRSPSELPLQRMKINFHSQLSISSQFTNWLSIAIEPDPEDRFSSAKEAIKKLNSKEVNLKLEQHKLVGSSVILKKSDREIVIIIPSKIKSSLETRLIILILILFLLCIALIISSDLLIAITVFFGAIAFLSPLIVFTILFLQYLLFCLIFPSLVDYTLRINLNNYIFIASFLGVKRRRQGSTKILKRIEFYHDRNFITEKKEKRGCVIRGNLFAYRFGSLLTKVEQEWLMQEISSFIDRVNS